MTRRVAILHDSPDFGGHERALLTWLPALLASPDIAELQVFTPAANDGFLSALAQASHPKLHASTSRFVKRRAEPYFAPFRLGYRRAVSNFVADNACDLVLLLQGRIENLATPMLCLPDALEMVSYLPMAHLGAEMGRGVVSSRVTDAVKRLYYARPQRIIVPSHAVAAQVARAGARGAIHVVENVPALTGAPRSRRASRAALSLGREARIALFMGRFDRRQKGLDRLLRDMARHAPALRGWTFLFVGRGPAGPDIAAGLERAGLSGRVVDWTADPGAYLAASDLLLAPSRFEGVPLVMLEALQRGLPILASDIDVYREYLPDFALRDFAQPVDLPRCFADLTEPCAVQAYRRHAAAVCARLDLAASRRKFLNAVLGRPDEAATAGPIEVAEAPSL